MYGGQSELPPTEEDESSRKKSPPKRGSRESHTFLLLLSIRSEHFLCAGAVLSSLQALPCSKRRCEVGTVNISILHMGKMRPHARGHLIQEVTLIPKPVFLTTSPGALC